MNIAIAPSMTEYFHAVVVESIQAKQIEITESALRYLVGLLCDFAHPDEHTGSMLSRPLTFQLRDAMDASGPERFRRLRSLGDGVLYVVGFFGAHMDLKGADRGYVVTVGSTAYDHAAAMLRTSSREAKAPDVLRELAAKFDALADVLSDVADGTLARGSKDGSSIVKLYERWLRTGSKRLAEELNAQGILPTRGAGGVN